MKYTDANKFGFLPGNNGIENKKALQRAVNESGTIIVSQQGVYKIAGTVYIGSNTTISFANGVTIQKVDEEGGFMHILLNKGALTKTFDENIRIENMHVEVNGIDYGDSVITGIRGHITLLYIRDLIIEGFRCFDLDSHFFAIHVCTFEDIIIRDAFIKGDKDGVHLGRGKRFYIGNCVFQTVDDAIALNAQDWDISNPELGWIEDGVIENCHDLDDGKKMDGFFCRMLAGGWTDWFEGMEVQKSDTVISDGRMYRVRAEADGRRYKSFTRPVHEKGEVTIDGINWFVAMNEVGYTAGVRNVIIRNIFLRKPRKGFALIMASHQWNRSYFKGATLPVQEKITLDNIRVLHNEDRPFIEINSAIDYLAINNTLMENTKIQFYDKTDVEDYLETILQIRGCVFNGNGFEDVIENKAFNKGKIIKLIENCNVFLEK